jgi:hypothetical protein
MGVLPQGMAVHFTAAAICLRPPDVRAREVVRDRRWSGAWSKRRLPVQMARNADGAVRLTVPGVTQLMAVTTTRRWSGLRRGEPRFVRGRSPQEYRRSVIRRS